MIFFGQNWTFRIVLRSEKTSGTTKASILESPGNSFGWWGGNTIFHSGYDAESLSIGSRRRRERA